MRIKLTLHRPAGDEVDVAITTDAAARVSDVGRSLALADPRSRGAVPGEAVTLRVLDARAEPRLVDPGLALGEAPLGSGSTVAIVAAGGGVPVVETQPVVTLELVEGQGAGKSFALTAGAHVIGRDATGADIVLDDPLVSKRHARLDAGPGTLRIVDLNSANGVEVDGGLVSRLDAQDGERVRLGDSVLRVRFAASISTNADNSAAPVAATGPVGFVRSPRVEARYPGQVLVAPELPRVAEPQAFPWLILAAPLILGGVLLLLPGGVQNPTSLLFVAMSPLLVVGNFLGQFASRRRKLKLDIKNFDERIVTLEQQLETERASEQTVRRAEVPTTAQLLAAVDRYDPLLWTRRPEHWQFLTLHLGTGTLPSRTSITVSGEETALPDYLTRLEQLRERFREVAEVPVAENLFSAGAFGVAGPRPQAADVARSLVVQAAALHSPSELVVTALVSGAWTPEFEWLTWLPHTASIHSPLDAPHLANSAATGEALLSALEDLVAKRGASKARRGAALLDKSALVAGASAGEGGVAEPPPSPVPAVLLVISDDAPVDRARLVQLAERGADAGVFPIWISRERAALPAVARTFVETGADPGTAVVGLVRLGTELVPVATEPVTTERALSFARRLAPVYDAGAVLLDASDLPRSVSLLSLIGPELAASAESALERWKQNDSVRSAAPASGLSRRPGRLRALVGQSGVDALHLDLRSNGPHALVGGTTGSGKSEFLQSWVLGMAAEYSPERVTFLFVDYKGGSAFADCVTLPHSVGLVTDLSPHLVRRALTSLRAELRFRERVLGRKKAKDLIELERRGDPETPPALVIVVDEFAALATDVPEFVDGVVDVAQRGRSLGIHLILATQRPAGVIRDNLRANTNLRIALRMADEADSTDVVGDKLAAGFDPAIPGRAVAKSGPGPLQTFQAAYAGGWTTAEPETPRVEVAELRFGAELLWETPGDEVDESTIEQGPTDQARLVRSLSAASALAKLAEPRRPWLDELAEHYDLTKLPQRTDTELLLGVADLPETQQQQPVFFRPDADGHLAVYGTGGSGKTVLLRTLAAAAGITPRGGPVDVYALDFAGGGLRMLEALPHVGSVVTGDDSERVARLLRTLSAELTSRAERFAVAKAGTIAEYRTLAHAPEERRILLLVDGYPAFRSEYEQTSALAPVYALFQDLVTAGRQLGLHVVITADRPGGVPTAIASGIQRRVVLRLAEEQAYSLLDVPKDVLDAESPPGRAIIDGHEVQLAVVGASPSTADQSRAIEALAVAIAKTGRAEAAPVGALAAVIDPATLPIEVGGHPVLGVADDTLAPIGFEPSGLLLVAGPPGSGRSSALRWLRESVQRAAPATRAYYLGSARSELAALPAWAASALTLDDAGDLARTITAELNAGAKKPVLVIVESIADYLSTSADSAIVDLMKAVKRSDALLVAESETSTWSSSWPLLADIKAARTGLLLQPETMDGDMILRTAIPRGTRSDFPPGRGIWVSRGAARRVQLPQA